MKTPHFKVRNPLLEGRPKGRATRRYVYRDGKAVLIYEDPDRVVKKSPKSS